MKDRSKLERINQASFCGTCRKWHNPLVNGEPCPADAFTGQVAEMRTVSQLRAITNPRGEELPGGQSVFIYARLYAVGGISIVPILRDGSKEPVSLWAEYQRRRMTDQEMQAIWLGANPPGIATIGGTVSGGLMQLDLDHQADHVRRIFLEHVASEFPVLAQRLSVCSTPRAGTGFHVRWRCPDAKDFPNGILAAEHQGDGRYLTLIHGRGTASYCLAPGSPGECHPTGGLYFHVAGDPPWSPIVVSLAEHEALLRIARSLDDRPGPRAGRAGRAADTGGRPGDPLVAWGDWSKILLPHQWEQCGGHGDVIHWRRPGKEKGSHSATTGHCVTAGGVDLLHVFSSNASPFESGQAYDKFAVYALLNHSGDFSAAARALAKLSPAEYKRQLLAEDAPEPARSSADPTTAKDGNIKSGDQPFARGTDHPGELGNLQFLPNADAPSDPGTNQTNSGEQPNQSVNSPQTNQQLLTQLHWSDRGNAEGLVGSYGKQFHWVQPWETYLVNDGTRWKADDTEAMERFANCWVRLEQERTNERTRMLLAALAKPEDRKAIEQAGHERWVYLNGCENVARIRAMLASARSIPGIAVVPAAFDADPLLFNCPNGTFNFKTGKLQRHNPDDMITQLCPTSYDAEAKCPTFEEFLRSVFKADRELICFVQRLLGLCLTGLVNEDVLVIFHGKGRNGKTTLLSAVMHTMGDDYCWTANEEFLVLSKNKSHPTELASLHGKRLVVCAETGQGRWLNQARVKQLTGGGAINVRKCHQDEWTLRPTWKLILDTNDLPKVPSGGDAVWERLTPVPFEVQFWNPDDPEHIARKLPPELRQKKGLLESLKAEAPGVLAWLIRGAMAYLADGLGRPPAVVRARQAYKDSEDQIARFIADCCEVHQEDSIGARKLFEAYKKWAEEGKESPVFGERDFKEAMVKKHEWKKTKKTNVYQGLTLRKETPWDSE